MGRGGYLGGSTMLHGGGGLIPYPEGRKAQGTKRRRRSSLQMELEQAKHDKGKFIAQCFAAYLKGGEPPKPPRAIRSYLVAPIREAGGTLEWASTQPEFRKLLDRHNYRQKGR